MAGEPQAPENGFWVIITQDRGPAETTVRYYDLQDHLIREEHLAGVRLNGKKKRTRRMLNQSLQTALVAWAAKGQPAVASK